MNNNIYWGGADHWYCGYCGKGPGHADDCTRPQPTASVAAEPVLDRSAGVGVMTNPSPIKTRIAWHCDPQCGCQYLELLPEDRICIARMTKDEQDALFERNKGLSDDRHTY